MTHHSLGRFALLSDLDDAELTILAAVAHRRQVQAGHLLFRRGDPTPGLHLIESGMVKIYQITPGGEERIIDIIGPGDLCGEMGIVDRAPSGAWGEALTPLIYREIPAAAFERQMLQHPALCLKVCRVLVAKLRLASRQMEETLYLSSRQRVLRQLIRLVEKLGHPAKAGGVQVDLRLTHQEIAYLAGTARETVSRLMSDLQRQGLLRHAERQMIFPDLAPLRQMAAVEEVRSR